MLATLYLRLSIPSKSGPLRTLRNCIHLPFLGVSTLLNFIRPFYASGFLLRLVTLTLCCSTFFSSLTNHLCDVHSTCADDSPNWAIVSASARGHCHRSQLDGHVTTILRCPLGCPSADEPCHNLLSSIKLPLTVNASTFAEPCQFRRCRRCLHSAKIVPPISTWDPLYRPLQATNYVIYALLLYLQGSESLEFVLKR
ncbi:hypothetical protein EDB86DRAFT_596624 [Lactarius hatsudake]|nr:hypothetical protein EDB86DRAFT_596624 [Lactarius hatsudake]